MLPDFPETKLLFSRFFQAYMRVRIQEISPFGMVRTRHIHEGRRMRVTRPDESRSESEMVLQSVGIEINFEEIESMTFENVIEKYNTVIAQMAGQQANFVRSQLSAEIPESNSVDGRGRKFDAQMVIEMKEKMQIEFYPDGTPHEIFVDGPIFTPECLAEIEKEFSDNPELKKKHDEVMEKKKEEWLAREADRKLVG